jgi:Flp pilus assembly protein TadG
MQITRYEFVRRSRRLHASEAGVSALEFTLLLPFFLTLMLTILQIALIVQAKFVVNHAAYCAVRCAIVAIPGNIVSSKTRKQDAHNQIAIGDENSPKMRIIHRAAALPLTSISPLLGGAAATGTAINPSLLGPLARVAAFFSAGAKSASDELAQRAHYAYDNANTKVEIIPENRAQRLGRFGDHDLVTVRVTYRYYLTVPIASRILGKAYPISMGGSGRYIEITEQYTLVNAGEPAFPRDQMPRGGDVEMEVHE